MTDTPISDAAMYCSEPHGYQAVAYCVAQQLERENAALKKALEGYNAGRRIGDCVLKLTEAHAARIHRASIAGSEIPPFPPPGEPEEVYSPHTKMEDA